MGCVAVKGLIIPMVKQMLKKLKQPHTQQKAMATHLGHECRQKNECYICHPVYIALYIACVYQFVCLPACLVSSGVGNCIENEILKYCD